MSTGTTPAQYAAMATLLDSMLSDVRVLLGLLTVDVAGALYELPLSNGWQPIPGVPGVEMASLSPEDWPADAREGEDYHLVRGPGHSHSPGLLKVHQSVRLEIIVGHQRYWKESVPCYVDYYPGDIFTCMADEGHQWETFEPFCNRVSFSPALFPRFAPEPDSDCLTPAPL